MVGSFRVHCGLVRFYNHRVWLSSRCSQSTKSPSFQEKVAQPFIRYFKRLKWVPIPLSVGFAYIGYQQYRHIREREMDKLAHSQSPDELLAKEWQVKLYCSLPLNAASRLFGHVCQLEVPVWLRPPVYKLYMRVFKCNLDEALVTDLEQYRSISEFFRRRLRPECRPIDTQHSLVSPCDGTVLSCGPVTDGRVGQVKGVDYGLTDFLGTPVPLAEQPGQSPNTRPTSQPAKGGALLSDAAAYEKSLVHHKGNRLYACTIYLSPGDCHVFYSPTSWVLGEGRHFPGLLLSVSVGVARWIKDLFVINERAVYTGTWAHGFFAFAAVGATNVGSVHCFHDKTLATNQKGHRQHKAFSYIHRPIEEKLKPAVKGREFGEFNFGSTIVLIFEAPADFAFSVREGNKLKIGETLGNIQEMNNQTQKLRKTG